MNINFVITNICAAQSPMECIETYPFTFLRPKGRAEYFLINSGDSWAKFTPHPLISYHMKEQNCKALHEIRLLCSFHYVWQTISHQNIIHFYNGQCNVLPLVNLGTTSTCPSHATLSVVVLGIVRKGNDISFSVHRKTILKEVLHYWSILP